MQTPALLPQAPSRAPEQAEQASRSNFRTIKSPVYSWVYVRQYCAKIDEAARNRMELIVPELAKRNGVTEKLKADTKWNGYGR